MPIEIAIGYDKETKEYKAYEPTTDTLLITTSLGETFLKLSEFLQDQGLIAGDLLSTQDITYHIDSPSFIAMVESNANLLKRLQTGPSGFQVAAGKLAVNLNSSPTSSSLSTKDKKSDWKKASGGRSSGMFSNSSFKNSNKKFGGGKWNS